MFMANTAVVYARIDPTLKKDVDKILATLGITPSSLIQMMYSEIKLTKRVPLSLSAIPKKPLYVEELTEEELANELRKGLKSSERYSLDETKKILKKALKK